MASGTPLPPFHRDFNGDGLDDLVVGQRALTPFDPQTARVVFGKTDPAPVDVGALGSGGLVILDSAFKRGGAAPVGDFNGDGLADVAITKSDASPRGRRAAGSVFVVFGAPGGGSVSLRSLGARGIRIDGARPRDHLADDEAGPPIAGVGDVDGDGIDDIVLVADPYGSAAAVRRPSSVYVVFGRRSPTDIDLADSRAGVRRLMLHMAHPTFGWFVEAAGDVDADGRSDFLVDAAGYPESSCDENGYCDDRGWLVLGRALPQLHAIEAAGLDGALAVADPGERVLNVTPHGVGDLDGDGHADLVVGGENDVPTWFVLWGASMQTRLWNPRRATWQIDVADWQGPYTGDVNGDGRADMLALCCDGSAYVDTRQVVVRYGARRRGRSALGPLPGADGVRLVRHNRIELEDSPGDLNGDGRSDVVITYVRQLNPRQRDELVVILDAASGPLELDQPGTRAFLIRGAG
jgi:hypothetical protein